MLLAATAVTVLMVAGSVTYYQYFARKRLLVSTTTSLYDTGLLDVIERAYESNHDIDVQFIPVGTGLAIQQAQRGDADLVIVHSPALERAFLKEGYGVSRKIIAYNFFTIVGPREDPASISGLDNVSKVLERIVEYGRDHKDRKVWISREDNSGTHAKEKYLWKGAGFNCTRLSEEPWFASPGGGMGETLLKAQELSLYTVSDTGTYLKYSKEGRINLVAFLAEDRDLLNVYSAIAVNQTRNKHVNFEIAVDFIKFLISAECQQLIESYGRDEYGQSLFRGTVAPLKQDPSPQVAQWIKSYSFLEGSECPPQYRDPRAPELYN